MYNIRKVYSIYTYTLRIKTIRIRPYNTTDKINSDTCMCIQNSHEYPNLGPKIIHNYFGWQRKVL